MKLKCGRREFEITKQDLVMFNGNCYQLITHKYFDISSWSRLTPIVAKTTMKRLIKEGKVVLLPDKYMDKYDLYGFVISEE